MAAEDFLVSLTLTVDGYADDRFTAFRMSGRDKISEVYRYEIDVLAESLDLDLSDLLDRSAILTISRGDVARTIPGIVFESSMEDLAIDGRGIYRIVLTPRLQRLSLSRQTQVHGTTGDMSVDQVIADELTASKLQGPASTDAGRLGENDYELHFTQAYPKRDYIVQYAESDLNFISRLAENAGIFFYFDDEDGADLVVFGDNNGAFQPTDNVTTIPYRTVGGMQPDSFAVTRFRSVARNVPRKVYLRDYNWRTPHVSLVAEADVDPNGRGVVVEYGSHFRTPEEGVALARVRAEEILVRKHSFEGVSNCFALSAGSEFTLSDHFRAECNDEFVVTEIEHSVTLPVQGVDGVAPAAYSNRFVCIPKSVPFRPERRTPKPVVPGLSNAMIDGTQEENRADIDENGSYKVLQAFDMRGIGDGKASRFVRKADPYGGHVSGMHFPLPKGTEVVLACVNGDPDRPVIVGAVPNEFNRSVVGAENRTVNRLQSTAGALFEMKDGNSVQSTAAMVLRGFETSNNGSASGS